MNKSICLHVAFNGEGALPYCSICAPKEIFALRKENERLRKSLESAHFTDEGGKLCKPPVQNEGVFEKIIEENNTLWNMLDSAYNEYIFPNEVWREWGWANEYRRLRNLKKEGK